MILSGDLGGTKILLRLEDNEKNILRKASYASADYDNLQSVIHSFLLEDEKPESICIAVAGPVMHDGNEQTAKITNLPWHISSMELKKRFGATHACLINDFAAIAWGIDELQDEDMICLQQGNPKPSGSKAIIGAGTGLGQAFISYENDRPRIHSTEGGHTDFAATTMWQWELREKLSSEYEHVSYELILSGKGLVSIFRFLAEKTSHPDLAGIMNTPDPAAEISQLAAMQIDPVAVSSMDMFIEIYGAQAGNFALNTLPFGGVFIAGGIAAKNQYAFQTGLFIKSFLAKGKMRDLMPQFPVFVIKDTEVGLKGAARVARNKAGGDND